MRQKRTDGKNDKPMKDRQRDNVIFRKAWWQSIKQLPSEARLEIYDHICKYSFDGIVPEYNPMSAVSVAFSFIKQDIDAAKDKYDDICSKRAEAGRRHTGNQYTRGTNGTNVPIKEQTEQTELYDNDNNNENENEEKEKQKDKSFSFSQKKEKIILDFSLLLLAEGRPNAYNEAREAYEYNESTDWMTETTLPNGCVKKKKISNKLAWLRGWKRKNEQIFAPADGDLFAQFFAGIESIKTNSECVINQFRGIRDGDEKITLLFSTNKAIERFRSAYESTPAFQNVVCSAIRKRYPKAEIIEYKTI